MTEWMMVLMDFGCMVFIAKTALEHVYFVRDLQPQIDSLIERAEAFERRTEEEIELRSAARSRLSDIREALRETERQLEDVRRKLNVAHKSHDHMETVANQTRFRRGVQSGRRIPHAAATVD